jgi:hypothetical protein
VPRLHLSPPARAALAAVATAIALLGALPVGRTAAASPDPTTTSGLTLAAHVELQGHVRVGSWFGIAVDLANSGPTVTGELRIAGGSDSRSQFSTPVELATGSRKQYVLYALPPQFGGDLVVQLVNGGAVLAKATVAIALADAQQLVVGVVSENPGKIIGQIDLLPSQTGSLPVLVPLTVGDLPERIQAWAAIDRLVWQDTDTSTMTPGALKALAGWIAGGGRLVIVGGTAGPAMLAGLPDELLPYRPTATLDIDPAVLRPMLGGLPADATPLTAFAGDLAHGRTLAMSGDRVVAADMAYGAGSVTLLGFDPTTTWISTGNAYDTPLWRRLLPGRTGVTVSLTDDSSITNAVTNLPSLALPPIGGLIVLLVGYILLIGPVNYLVLRRLDRREWAWVTVPALIAVFAAGAFGFGALQRGSQVIVHEVAIVRGSPGTDQAVAQSYLGIFSPNRATFQLKVAGEALLAAPINGDAFGGTSTGGLDVLQGDPSRVRNLEVGFGSMRIVRAEAPATGPVITADLRLVGGKVTGTITNGGSKALLDPVLVLGTAAISLSSLAPGATTEVSLAVSATSVNYTSMSDRIVGQINFGFNGGGFDENEQRKIVRHSILDQLTMDPRTGFSRSLSADSAVIVGWGEDPVVPLEVEGAEVRRVANVMYEIPVPFAISGQVTFGSDLLTSTVVDQSTAMFSKDPTMLNFGPGTVRMSYRPIAFAGLLTATRVSFALNQGGDITLSDPGGTPIGETTRCDPAKPDCVVPADGLPDLEFLDVRTGSWVQFKHPAMGAQYTLDDPARWVDPSTGELNVRFVNERQDGISFQFPIAISGIVK